MQAAFVICLAAPAGQYGKIRERGDRLISLYASLDLGDISYFLKTLTFQSTQETKGMLIQSNVSGC